jgi:hypothetical protein
MAPVVRQEESMWRYDELPLEKLGIPKVSLAVVLGSLVALVNVASALIMLAMGG